MELEQQLVTELTYNPGHKATQDELENCSEKVIRWHPSYPR